MQHAWQLALRWQWEATRWLANLPGRHKVSPSARTSPHLPAWIRARFCPVLAACAGLTLYYTRELYVRLHSPAPPAVGKPRAANQL